MHDRRTLAIMSRDAALRAQRQRELNRMTGALCYGCGCANHYGFPPCSCGCRLGSGVRRTFPKGPIYRKCPVSQTKAHWCLHDVVGE